MRNLEQITENYSSNMRNVLLSAEKYPYMWLLTFIYIGIE